MLTEDEAKEVLSRAGVPVTPCQVVFSAREAARAAREIGFPVVLKVRSAVITHKTDVGGGVYLNLKSITQVRRAFYDLMKKVRHRDLRAGAAVQPMAPSGIEVITGMTGDPQFGPVRGAAKAGGAVRLPRFAL